MRRARLTLKPKANLANLDVWRKESAQVVQDFCTPPRLRELLEKARSPANFPPPTNPPQDGQEYQDQQNLGHKQRCDNLTVFT